MIKKYKVVHIIANEKFIKPFIDFIEKNFRIDNHVFIFMYGGNEKDFPIPKRENIVNINNLFLGKKNLIRLSKIITPYFDVADKVILHSLFSNDLINYLYLHQKFLQKCYWVMWGGDLYAHVLSRKTIRSSFSRYRKKIVIQHMAGLISYIKGDYELARKWYDAKGQYHECFMYPSNLYKDYDMKPKEDTTINIQVGNSANPTNHHFEVIDKLKKYKDEDIKIIIPLAYGGDVYAKKVIDEGRKIFGDKIIPLTEFMPFNEYLELLSSIDIAIFNHNRQQAMGNIITLLGLGKKVYMRNDITPWKMFQEIGIDVFDIDNFSIDLLDEDVKLQNQRKIKEHFSKEKYLKQLNDLFRG